MGKANKTRKFAAVKRMLNPKDPRLSVNAKSKDIQKRSKDNAEGKSEVSKLNSVKIREMEKQKVGMFFEHNTSLEASMHQAG